MRTKERIFLIDQSAEKIGGHYIEYLLRLKKAIDEFFVVVLVGNSKVSRNIEGGTIIPAYRLSYFKVPFEGQIRLVVQAIKKMRGLPLRINRGNGIHYIKSYVLNNRIRFREDKSKFYSNQKTSRAYLLKLVFFLLLGLVAIVPVLVAMPLVILILLMFRNVGRVFRKVVNHKPTFKIIIRSLSKYFENLILMLKSIQFKKDTMRLIANYRISDSDILFFSTIGLHEIHGLFKAVSKKHINPRILIMLRREPEENYATYSDWQYLASLAKNLNVRFFSDTNGLAQDFSKLFGFNVEVFPIPFGNIDVNASKKSPRKFSICYVGDARLEKQFIHFAELAEHIQSMGLKIFCQMNQPGKENFEISVAVNRLSQILPIDHISTHSMDSESYNEVLANSDVVYLDYLAKNYRSRSSGVLVEALASGANVITSDGSWMHREIDFLNTEYFSTFSYGQNASLFGNNLPLNGRGIYRFLGKPNAIYRIHFLLNTGVQLSSTGWADEKGSCYLPTPLTWASEELLAVHLDNPPFGAEFAFAKVPLNQQLRLLGSITNAPSRCLLAYKELAQFDLTLQTKLELTKPFLEFHSEKTILRTFEAFK